MTVFAELRNFIANVSWAVEEFSATLSVVHYVYTCIAISRISQQLEHEATWCSTFSCLEASQTGDSAGFQVSLSQNQIDLQISVFLEKESSMFAVTDQLSHGCRAILLVRLESALRCSDVFFRLVGSQDASVSAVSSLCSDRSAHSLHPGLSSFNAIGYSGNSLFLVVSFYFIGLCVIVLLRSSATNPQPGSTPKLREIAVISGLSPLKQPICLRLPTVFHVTANCHPLRMLEVKQTARQLISLNITERSEHLENREREL
ncbi:hypothetical protein CSKR_114381 [Clonorchis sinensis]|uniref:Uncharacterized protein n=1 Tax=Clonorchis sinensis TaxID=79923 RepID=A0A419Q276_CLOSI|nr:hypothetical protein CSKR_114381 [Clonorchis sinensis]